jgi:hypothetical protein
MSKETVFIGFIILAAFWWFLGCALDPTGLDQEYAALQAEMSGRDQIRQVDSEDDKPLDLPDDPPPPKKKLKKVSLSK